MSKHIFINRTTLSYGLNFGNQANYKSYVDCYFEKIKENFIDKAILYDIECNLDSTYIHTDGNSGTCWCAKVLDSEEESIIYYHFRNFEDLVAMYEEKGYKFVKINIDK